MHLSLITVLFLFFFSFFLFPSLVSSPVICCVCFSRGSDFIVLCQLTLDLSVHPFYTFHIKAFCLNRVSHLEGHLITLTFGRCSSVAGSFPDRHLCGYVSIQAWTQKALVLLRKWPWEVIHLGYEMKYWWKCAHFWKLPCHFDFLVSLVWNDLFFT